MLTEKALVSDVQLTNATVVYYTTSSKVRTVIMQATICNTTGGSVNLTLYLCGPGIGPGAANTLFAALPIAAGQTLSLAQMINHVLEPGGSTIQALGPNLSFRVSGYEKPA